MYLQIFLIFIILILLFIIILILKKEKNSPIEIENILNKVWKNSGIEEKIGQVNLQAKEIKDLHNKIERMLSIPQQRGSFGEIALEKILEDQLPPEMYGIRTKILNGKIPDAYINSTIGTICIDSKFPLENYRKMLETEDENEKEGYKNQFLKDLEGHLEKIRRDYITPESGSAEFAFAFIPSEGVYWFLVSQAYEILNKWAKKGVQVVSPMMISSRIELIKAGVHSKKLSEDAEKVKGSLQYLSKFFESLDNEWKIFSEKHLRGLVNKAEEIDKCYRKIREEFERISKLQ